MLGQTLKQELLDLEQKRNSLKDKVQPYAMRFMRFLEAHQEEFDGFIDFNFPSEDENAVPFTRYKLDDNAHEEGFFISYWEENPKNFYAEDEPPYHHLLYFTVPFGYIDDPEAWESSFTDTITRQKQEAVDALKSLVAEAEVVSVYGNSSEGRPDVFTVEVKSNVPDEPELFSYDGHIFWNTSFNYYTETKNIFLTWDSNVHGEEFRQPFTGTLSNEDKSLSADIVKHMDDLHKDLM